ncbi:hypothetical protein QKW60_04535 [Defluviimonas aestuarii]|uniref:hypothetical protein n=1 Tax=Albidovulum aestuarii TaxID=1130726 RepID=UPI00249BBC74|nr:hypothetical protein [Defluviimonas aestuarii]MDI3335659.1 hypothetical protein [Defluviimonas aestuarii]
MTRNIWANFFLATAFFVSSISISFGKDDELSRQISSLISSTSSKLSVNEPSISAEIQECNLRIKYEYKVEYCIPTKIQSVSQTIDLRSVGEVYQSEFNGLYAITFYPRDSRADSAPTDHVLAREDIEYCSGDRLEDTPANDPTLFIEMPGRESFSALLRDYIIAVCEN